MLNRYRDLAFSIEQGRKPSFTANYVAHPTFALIKRGLDLSAAVIGGISPDLPPDSPEAAEHAVLIAGYGGDYLATGDPWLIVRDPYPCAPGREPLG